MRRTFNYTGRRKIPQSLIRITVEDSDPRQFDVHWSPESIDMPEDGEVIVEAFSSGSNSVSRYSWGRVANPLRPPDTALTGVEGDTVVFNFKVVDSNHENGRLIGVARNVRPVNESEEFSGGRQSILPVNALPLEDQVWRLNLSNDRPWLEVNSQIDGIKELTRSDPTFFSLVYPQAIRRILLDILVFQDRCDPDESAEEWQCQWLRWGRYWHTDREDPPETGTGGDHDDQLEWIEEVVRSFCRRHDVASRFMAAQD